MKFLVYLFIILIPFQDFFLGNTILGYLGHSISFIPLAAIFLLRSKTLFTNKYFWFISLYILIINLLYFLLSGKLMVNGENVIIKSIKLFVITLLFITPIFLIDYKKYKNIREVILFTFFISLTPLICSFFYGNIIDTSLIFHATNNGNLRPRGFAMESSLMGLEIVTLGLLAAFYCSNKYFRLIILLLVLFSLIYIDSKGGIACFVLATIFTLLTFLRFSRIKNILLFAFSLVALCYVYNFFEEKILIDIENYNSVATRLILMINSFLILLFNPLGVGFSGFYEALNHFIPESIKLVTFQLNFNEVLSYVNAIDGSNISAKTILFNYSIFFGLPFLLIFYKFFKSLIIPAINHSDKLLYFNLIFTLCAISTYVDSTISYNIPLVLGIIFNKFFKSRYYERIK